MGKIDVEKAIEELTLGEKVALTAGRYLLASSTPTNAHAPRQEATSGTQFLSHA